MSRSRGQSNFSRKVDGWVLAAIESGATSFQEILVSLPGVFPTDLVRSLQRLGLRGQARGVTPASAQPVIDTSYVTDLPVPHLLDYDWRFTPDTARLTVDRSLDSSSVGDQVLFIGTPTSALNAANRNIPRQLTLLESNPAAAAVARMTNRVDVHESNALCLTPIRPFADVLVLDPPWYRDYLHCFLNVAAAWSSPGATILLAVPPLGTRPEVQAEHAELERVCGEMGLRLIRSDQGMLRYVTPPYEINALLACGLQEVHPTWRCGDLWTLEKVDSPEGSVRVQPKEAPWADLPLLGIRFKVRRNVDNDMFKVDPRLVPIVPGDVCPAVSRYHPLRAQADVWTSGNRVFECRCPDALIALLEAIAQSRDPISVIMKRRDISLSRDERAFVSETISQVLQLVELERRELATLRHHYGGAEAARNAS